ncbi:hypothetical protein ACXU4B_00285 [Dyella soli]|uniref:Uncharacterized protein n=1 Tax=Dyella soli TaxID=522319 RepID=A0A4R0YRP3_9GAMM|nr:hypothetical protein [Dyella soli]TCI09518.1 hypothetical protein EZM97_11155 [Dyella soli]
MTLTNRPRNNTPPGSTANVVRSPLLTPEELTAIVDAEYQHVDYDLHPLKVRGLDHYIDGPDGDERFHIS